MNLQRAPQFTREMRPGEEAAVETLLQAAFRNQRQAALVRKLRKSGSIAGECILPMDDQVVGYYALSYMVKPKGWLTLAPLAIDPAVQRHGYARRMMGMLTEWARLTQTPIIVFDPQGFYEKVGFSKVLATHLQPSCDSGDILLAGLNEVAPAQDLIRPAAFGK